MPSGLQFGGKRKRRNLSFGEAEVRVQGFVSFSTQIKYGAIDQWTYRAFSSGSRTGSFSYLFISPGTLEAKKEKRSLVVFHTAAAYPSDGWRGLSS